MSLMCFLVSLVILVILVIVFLISASGREGFLLSSFCLVFFSLFFSRGEDYFNSLAGKVRDSSSADQSMT